MLTGKNVDRINLEVKKEYLFKIVNFSQLFQFSFETKRAEQSKEQVQEYLTIMDVTHISEDTHDTCFFLLSELTFFRIFVE